MLVKNRSNSVWIVAFVLLLAGCGGSSSSTDNEVIPDGTAQAAEDDAQAAADQAAADQAAADQAAADQAAADQAAADQAAADQAAADQAAADQAAADQAAADQAAADQAAADQAAADQAAADQAAADQAAADQAAADQAAADQAAAEAQQQQQPVVGEPGVSVDCRFVLPCTWVAQDSAISLAISGVGQDSNDNLRAAFSVVTNRDTSLILGQEHNANGDEGSEFDDNSIVFGNDSSTVRVITKLLFAELPLNGAVVFGQDLLERHRSLSRLEIDMSEVNGIGLLPIFFNLPTGVGDGTPSAPVDRGTTGAPGENVDCLSSLNCTWVSANGSLAITISYSGPSNNNDRLAIGYSVLSTERVSIAVSEGDSFVRGIAGDEYDPYSVVLGNSSSTVRTLSRTLYENIRLNGAHYFSQTLESSGIARLQLDINSSKEGQLNPVFLNMPYQ